MIEIQRAIPADVETLVAPAAALAREDPGQRDPFANRSLVKTERGTALR